ncbi:hypothetical protein [Methanoculleus sp.]|jgi:hypothetical protein|uniref:hypothetical protein n=1 Tax=Methanoculleus sp. TaxID=90427 RepID=UPI00261A30A4|nr:hypothetical protein [Methanoculleus sp.]MDI6866171.1 hypothetical protein [Methanoculleus sp.]
MKKKTFPYGFAVSAIAIIVAWAALAAALIPLWAAVTIFVIAFPLLVLFLTLWWRAPGGEEDIPFIGY